MFQKQKELETLKENMKGLRESIASMERELEEKKANVEQMVAQKRELVAKCAQLNGELSRLKGLQRELKASEEGHRLASDSLETERLQFIQLESEHLSVLKKIKNYIWGEHFSPPHLRGVYFPPLLSLSTLLLVHPNFCFSFLCVIRMTNFFMHVGLPNNSQQHKIK